MAAGEAGVLVVTPNPADGDLAVVLLASHGISARRLADLRALAGALEEGIGCAILVEEALDEAELPVLREALERLPPWRDVPLVIVAHAPTTMSDLVAHAFPSAANVTLLERPLNRATLVSAVQTGLRATRRQLEVAALIAEREQAVRSRDEFLAMLAHELRNPLAPMRNAVHLQKGIEHPDPLFRKTREVLERQTAHIAHLVDDLVDVARLEKGKMVIQRSRVELNSVVSSAIEAVQPLTQARGHQMQTELDAEPLPLDADLTRIEQIACNLLVNAAKYTPKAGAIRVATRREGAFALLEVQDRGVGFAAAEGEAFFGLFVQGSQTLARTQGGLGIGLTIARRLAELHGGTIAAQSDGPGKGSTFTVRLPLASGPAEAVPPPREIPVATRKHVLIVDDSADIRETMRLLLTQWGHDVTLAASGEEGLDQIARARPDVAFIDIGLPGMSGYELAARIRAMHPLEGVRLIALTGYGQPADGKRALASGFDRHLLKPLAPDALRETIGG